MHLTLRRASIVAMLITFGCDRRTLVGDLMPCNGNSGRHLPFHALDLGVGNPPRAPYVTGPEGHEIVTDSTQWRIVWSRYAPALARPPMSFRDSIVLLVASRAYASGPRTVRIVDVQRCPSGDVAVMTQAERRDLPRNGAEHTVAAVAMERGLIGTSTLHFVELPDHWTR